MRGAERLDNDIKLVYAVASNVLVNQHANINRTAKILQDERLVEFIVVQDNFLTPSARFADIVLPACTQLETWGVEDGWKYGDEVLLMPKVVEPPGEAKSDYAICAAIAAAARHRRRLHRGPRRASTGWTGRWGSTAQRGATPGLPTLAAMEASNAGVYSVPVTKPAVAFEDFRRDPARAPLPTPSGKIEIFSQRLHALNQPHLDPGACRSTSPSGRARSGRRPHGSRCSSSRTTRSRAPTRRWPAWTGWKRRFRSGCSSTRLDAAARTSENGDEVRVFNDRGETRVRCRVTRRIMPGVVALPQGAWWAPSADGVDHGGSANVLTSERWTPLAFGNAQHTVMVEVRKMQSGTAFADHAIRNSKM